MSKKIYLCGPINGCSDDQAITWRDWFKYGVRDREYGARLQPYLTDVTYIDPMKRDYRGKESEDYREIVELDKRDIRQCDVVVVMYTTPSVGTSMEILYAQTLGVPVVVIDESGRPISPWLRYHSTAIVSSKENAVAKIKEWFS
jgi:nucleoside 2-deoxyribosyltransferase